MFKKLIVRKIIIYIITLIILSSSGLSVIKGKNNKIKEYNEHFFINEIERINININDYTEINNFDSNINFKEWKFYGQCNKSIFIVKVSTQNEIILDSLSFIYKCDSKGKKYSTGNYYAGCHIFEESSGDYLEPLIFSFDYDINSNSNLRYLKYNFGDNIQFIYDNRTLIEFDNGTISSKHLEYSLTPIIPPGNWYFIFSNIVFDLNQDEVNTKWNVWINISGNCDEVNITSNEGGTVYGLWYGEYDARLIVSKSNILEFMNNGIYHFQINNTFFYWYLFTPIMRGYWKIKWMTPTDIRTFNMLVWKGIFVYDKDDIFGCVLGMGDKGNYTLRLDYLDYGRLLFGGGIAFYPIFLGLDIPINLNDVN